MSELIHANETMPERTTGQNLNTASYYLAFVTLGTAGAVLGPTLLNLAKNTGVKLGDISLLFAARSIGYLIGSVLGGRLYDRRPGHPVMSLMLIGLAVALALMPEISLFWILVTVVLLAGLAEGTIDVGGNTLLVWLYRHHVGPYMNGLHLFFGIGAIIAPLLIAQVIQWSGSINWAFWLLAVLPLPTALWLLRLPSPKAQPTSVEGASGQTDRRLVALTILFFFLYVGVEVSFGGWVFTYAVKQNLATEAAAAYLTSAFWGAFTLGRLVSIPISLRVRPRYILLWDLIGTVIFLAILVIWPNSEMALWIGVLGVGAVDCLRLPYHYVAGGPPHECDWSDCRIIFVGASIGAKLILPWVIGYLV
ncbi:MAG: MFS transporter [Anaerolineae bacterium]